MKSGIVLLFALCFNVCLLTAQPAVPVHPLPQEVKVKGGIVKVPEVFQLSGETTANPFAVALLKSFFKGERNTVAKFTVCIGERGDKSVRKYASLIPRIQEGYYLSVAPDRIVIAGNDERGTYYAVQTLAQLLRHGELQECEIKDFPSVPFRGVVEGFYGTPWSHEARLRQLEFYGENKLNTYIYGPKDDPYHSCPNWRKPYPQEEAEHIRELAKVARKNQVDFVWAIHPGQDIKWNDTDRNLLLEKFEKMYQLGVRSFAVFFDDISGEGTDPVRQADLLNYIDEHFVKVKKDVTPLIMCPTEYNKSWSDPAKGYLATLGTKLNPSIHIMWTGDRVISDISEEGLKWVNEKIKRPAYIWWNFPVSDYVRDHLLMGPVYGHDLHIGKEMSGFVANPMDKAEASKIAIFGVAAYAWNPEKFNSETVWEGAIRAILPMAAPAFHTFAAHNSDLGPNGHRYRRDESVKMQPVAARFLENYRKGNVDKEDYAVLAAEYSKMVEAADILFVNQENRSLIEEIEPWIKQFRVLGLTGQEALAMIVAVENKDSELFMRKYNHVKALQQQRFLIDQTYNQNPYQPGVKTGSKIMQPLADTLFILATQRYNKQAGTALNCDIYASPHLSYSSISQCQALPVRVKTNRIIMSPMLEVVKWGAEQYLGMELDKNYDLKTLEADFGVKDCGKWLQLEISAEGKNWTVVPLTSQEAQIRASFNQKARFIRLVNKSNTEQEVYLRKFIITR